MSEPRSFKEDLINSNNPKLRKSWEKIFQLKFGDDCEIVWKDDLDTQKGLGTDTIIKTKQGRRYSVEIKTRAKSCYEKDWIMEIVSHIYDREEEPRNHQYSKEGWIYSTTAEYLFHGTLNDDGTDLIEVIFYSLIPFKTPKYKGEFEQYEKFWLPPTIYPSGQFQLTLTKLIPKEVIKRDAFEFWEWKKDENR